jgi:hypothetical protein
VSTFQLSAEHKGQFYGGDESIPQSVAFTLRVETPEQAREVAAQFPKSYKVRGGAISGIDNGVSYTRGHVGWSRKLLADGVNGGVNEAGIAAYHRMVKMLDKLGYAVEWAAPYANSYRTREQFETHI